MEAGFKRIDQENLRIKLEKCPFAASEAPFLGHVVGSDGLKLDAISKLKCPQTKTEVRNYLESTGYYRMFFPGYAGRAYPLFQTIKDAQPDPIIITEKSCSPKA